MTQLVDTVVDELFEPMSVSDSQLFLKFRNGHVMTLRSGGQNVFHHNVPSSQRKRSFWSMSPPRYNHSFRQWSGRDPISRASPGGALNQLGVRMGSWQGQNDVWDQSAASSVVSSLQSFLTPSRNSRWSCFHQRGSSAKFHSQYKQVSFQNNWDYRGIQAHAQNLPLCGREPTVVHGADPAPRRRGLMRKLRWVEAGPLAIMHTNFRSACSVKEHPLDSPKW